MNRRTLKKQCKRAMILLIAEHGFKANQFKLSDGEESVYSPVGLERRFDRNGFIEPGPLKGTPLLWLRTSYEYDEWDAHLPSEYLSELKFWADFEPSPADVNAHDEWARQKNEELHALRDEAA